jgi:hypothetical protein
MLGIESAEIVWDLIELKHQLDDQRPEHTLDTLLGNIVKVKKEICDPRSKDFYYIIKEDILNSFRAHDSFAATS